MNRTASPQVAAPLPLRDHFIALTPELIAETVIALDEGANVLASFGLYPYAKPLREHAATLRALLAGAGR